MAFVAEMASLTCCAAVAARAMQLAPASACTLGRRLVGRCMAARCLTGWRAGALSQLLVESLVLARCMGARLCKYLQT